MKVQALCQVHKIRLDFIHPTLDSVGFKRSTPSKAAWLEREFQDEEVEEVNKKTCKVKKLLPSQIGLIILY